jgi:putative endonuclease
MFTVYILYSTVIDKYYVGYTGDELPVRLKKHLSKHRGFTNRAKDWTIVYTEIYANKPVAAKREKEIKKWKSKEKIQQLIGSTE